MVTIEWLSLNSDFTIVNVQFCRKELEIENTWNSLCLAPPLNSFPSSIKYKNPIIFNKAIKNKLFSRLKKKLSWIIYRKYKSSASAFILYSILLFCQKPQIYRTCRKFSIYTVGKINHNSPTKIILKSTYAFILYLFETQNCS